MKFGIQRAVEQVAKRTGLGDKPSWGQDPKGQDKTYFSFRYLPCSRGRHSWKLKELLNKTWTRNVCITLCQDGYFQIERF